MCQRTGHDPVVFVCVCVSVCRSKEPLGGLSRETEEIEVGNSHQKLPNQERCRQEPPCKGTEGSGGKGGECVCVVVGDSGERQKSHVSEIRVAAILIERKAEYKSRRNGSYLRLLIIVVKGRWRCIHTETRHNADAPPNNRSFCWVGVW